MALVLNHQINVRHMPAPCQCLYACDLYGCVWVIAPVLALDHARSEVLTVESIESLIDQLDPITDKQNPLALLDCRFSDSARG